MGKKKFKLELRELRLLRGEPEAAADAAVWDAWICIIDDDDNDDIEIDRLRSYASYGWKKIHVKNIFC